MFVYRRTEPMLWTVGHWGNGEWFPVDDYDTSAEAAERVNWLNGGNLIERVEALEAQISEMNAALKGVYNELDDLS